MRRTPLHLFLAPILIGIVGVPLACGSDNSGGSGGALSGAGGRGAEQTGQACRTATECFPNLIDGGAIHGSVVCMDRVTGGYCTHECQADTDCCAVPGECATSFPQVCAPFESTGTKYCFLSCEDADILAHDPSAVTDGGVVDGSLFCRTHANAEFGCRSTGGGRQNRKVCTP